eukprot:Hpha_TRINITY_DN15886_c3_g1::TRINITY_DN15886_c3_g1_i1::g.188103::m.188103/K12199/VTA1, LIP5; vacuolar protein sorting-associated protein VTA1
MADCPPALAQLKPYLARAAEFKERDPNVSHYCRKYAVTLGVKMLGQLQAPDKKFIGDLMGTLESDVKEGWVMNDDDAHSAVLKNAMFIFKRADDRERRSQGDKGTILMFYTAAVLMEVTRQFGEWDEELTQKHKYARWVAAEMKKCLTSGTPYISKQEPLPEEELGSSRPLGEAAGPAVPPAPAPAP